MNYSNLIIRIGFGLLFVWGGLEKFFEGFLGGIGLQNMADFLKASGLSFLGDNGTYFVGAALAFFELVAGVLVLANKQLKYAYAFLAFIMFMALVLVHIPSGNWMNIMIHIALFTTLTGFALENFSSKKSI